MCLTQSNKTLNTFKLTAMYFLVVIDPLHKYFLDRLKCDQLDVMTTFSNSLLEFSSKLGGAMQTKASKRPHIRVTILYRINWLKNHCKAFLKVYLEESFPPICQKTITYLMILLIKIILIAFSSKILSMKLQDAPV